MCFTQTYTGRSRCLPSSAVRHLPDLPDGVCQTCQTAVCQTPTDAVCRLAVWQVWQTLSDRCCLTDGVWQTTASSRPCLAPRPARRHLPDGRLPSGRQRLADSVWQMASCRRRLPDGRLPDACQTPSARQRLAVWQVWQMPSCRPRLAARRRLVLHCNWSEYEGKAWERR